MLVFGVAFIAVGYRSRTVRNEAFVPGSIQAEIIILKRNKQK